jgi:hypothetical protein
MKENTITKPTEDCLKVGEEGQESHRWGEFNQRSLYACTEISQGNPSVQLIDAN